MQAAGLKVGNIDATKPKHPELVQYYCSDWDFILSRADSQGLLVVATTARSPCAKVDLQRCRQGTRSNTASDEIFDLEFEADAGPSTRPSRAVAGASRIRSARVVRAKAFALSQGNLDGKKLAEAVGFGAVLRLSHPVPRGSEELQAWADATVAAQPDVDAARPAVDAAALGILDVARPREVAGIGKRFNGKALVTGVCHRVDDGGWRTDVQFGLSPAASARRTGIRDAPAAGSPARRSAGCRSASSPTSPTTRTSSCASRSRCRASIASRHLLWARLASPDAGKERGFFFRPEPGDEVVVGFLNDDPRQPVILGALYSSKNAPPRATSS